MGDSKIMFKTAVILVIIIFGILAFSWDPLFQSLIKHRFVDKTKEIVYNVYNNVKESERVNIFKYIMIAFIKFYY